MIRIILLLILAISPLHPASSQHQLSMEEQQDMRELSTAQAEELDIDALLADQDDDEEETDSLDGDNNDGEEFDVDALLAESADEQGDQTEEIDVDALFADLEEEEPEEIDDELIDDVDDDDEEEDEAITAPPATPAPTEPIINSSILDEKVEELDESHSAALAEFEEIKRQQAAAATQPPPTQGATTEVDPTQAIEELDEELITDEADAEKALEEVIAQELAEQQEQEPEPAEPVNDPTKPTVILDEENAAAFPQDGAEFTDQEEVTIPEDTDSFSLITPEQSAEVTALHEQEKKDGRQSEIKKEATKTAQSGKRKNMFTQSLKGLKEAGVDVNKAGLGMTGKLNFWGDQYARMTFAVTSAGILAQGLINEIKFGPLLTLSGRGPDGKYGTADDGVLVELRLDEKIQRFSASGISKLLGMLVQTDMAIGSDGVRLFSEVNLLNAFQTKVLGSIQGKGSNFDIIFAGALESDFLNFLETQAIKAVDTVQKFTEDGIKSAKKEVQKIKTSIKKSKQEIRRMKKTISRLEKAYNRKTRHAKKVIEPVQKKVRYLEKQVKKIGDTIQKIRRKLFAARESVLRRFRKAKEKVNRLSNEVRSAKRKRNQARRKAKWYKPWTYTVVAYWAARVAIVEAIRWAAEAVLNGIIAATNIVPIDAIPPLVALWPAYVASYTALKASYATLTAIRIATNPLAMKELGEMAGLGISIAGIGLGIVTQEAALVTAKATLDAALQAVKVGGAAAKFAMEAAAKLSGIVEPVRVTGGSIKFGVQSLLKGKMPRLGVTCRVFGMRKSIVLARDITKPETFVIEIVKAFIAMINPGHKNVDVMGEIEEMRKKYFNDFDDLDKKKHQLTQDLEKYTQQQKDHANAAEAIKQQGAAELAALEQRHTLKKGEGEYGQGLDFEKAAVEETFDPTDPTRYRAKKMMNAFRWWDKWELPETDSGTILFSATGSQDIHLGLHTQVSEKRNERTFDVVLGGWDNSRSALRDKDLKTLLSSDDKDAVIIKGDDFDASPYWLSYHHGYIAVGRGIVPGEKLMMEWQVEEPPTGVKFFSFSTHTNEVSYEQIRTAPAFHREFGTRYSVFDGSRQFVWHNAFKLPQESGGTILFNAKTERDLIIGLTDNTTTNHGRYVAALGAEQNTQSSLIAVSADGKKYDYRTISQDEDALITDGNNYKPYWITLDKGHFAVGAGTDPTKNLLLETLDPEPVENVTHFSFSSWDNGIEIRDIQVKPAVEIPVGSKYSAVNRKFTYEWREPWKLPTTGKGTITWRGKGASDMVVGLHTTGEESDNTAATNHIIIGANNNTTTVIKDHAGTVLATTTDTDALIKEQNNYNHYWVTYNQGYIALGTGAKAGEGVVLEYDGMSAPLTHFSLSNNTGFVEYQHIATSEAVKVTRGTQFTAENKQFSYTWRPEWQLPSSNGGVVIVRAKAAKDIVFGLHTNGNDGPKTCTVDVVIGAHDNTDSILRRAGQRIMFTQAQQTIKNTQNFSTYWLEYEQKSGMISCGRGATPGKDKILSGKLVEKPELTHFSLGSNNETVFYKDIAAYKLDDATTLEKRATHDEKHSTLSLVNETTNYEWQDAWKLNKPDSGAVLFSAKAASDICIGFTDDMNTAKDSAPYEIIIGSKHNSQTIITDNGTVVASSSDSDALIPKKGNYYTYWVSYRTGHITVGRGKQPGQRIMLEWHTDKPDKTITHFALSSKKSPVTYRDIGRTSTTQKMPIYHTYSADHRQGLFANIKQWKLHDIDQGFVTFYAKAERDIQIGLSRDKTSNPTYIVTLGADDNKQSAITKGGIQDVSTAPIAQITNTKEFMPYWLLFNRGFIKIGQGTTPHNNNTILSWHDPQTIKVMQYFSFGSADNQVSYHSIASRSLEEAQEAMTQTFYTANARGKTFVFADSMKLPTTGSGTISFSAQGKQGIRIGLTNGKNKTINPPYEVVIGAHNNTTTIIKKNGTEVARSDAQKARVLFEDSASAYWVTIKENGKITVGSGENPAWGTLLSWQDTTPLSVTHFGFSSDKHVIKFSDISVQQPVKPKDENSYEAREKKGKYSYDKQWSLPTQNSGSVIVEAQGEKDIMIGLNSKPSGVPQYEVVIGTEDNTLTIIKKDGVVVSQTDDIDATIKDKLIPSMYWVSYDNGTIAMGTGDKPGEEMLLAWSDPIGDKSTVTHFGLSNGTGTINYSQIKKAPAFKIAPYSFYQATARKGLYEWNNKQRLHKQGTLTFTANAPHADLRIGMHYVIQGSPQCEVRLGGWRNTLSAIMQAGKQVARHEHPIKLQEKPYWISYSTDRIAAGRGKPGEKVLLDWTNPSPRQLRYFAFSSGDDTITYKDIKMSDEVIWPQPPPAATPTAQIEQPVATVLPIAAAAA